MKVLSHTHIRTSTLRGIYIYARSRARSVSELLLAFVLARASALLCSAPLWGELTVFPPFTVAHSYLDFQIERTSSVRSRRSVCVLVSLCVCLFLCVVINFYIYYVYVYVST